MSTSCVPSSILGNKREHILQQSDIQQKTFYYQIYVFKTSWKNNYETHTHHLNKLFYLLESLHFHSYLSSNITSVNPSVTFSSSLLPQRFENDDDYDNDHKKNCTGPGTALSTLHVNPCSLHTNLLKGLNSFNFYRWGNPSTEKLSNLVKVTELTSGRTITQIQATRLQNPND